MKYKIVISLLGLLSLLACSSKKNISKSNTNIKSNIVLMETSEGNIKIKLYDATPLHRDNFKKLCTEHYYDSLLFHRVIQNFMIQGGDPDSKKATANAMLGNGGPNYTIPAEIVDTIFHKKGVIAAARDNNPEKRSSGSQFYIVQGKKWDKNSLEMMGNRSGKKMTEKQIQTYINIGGTPHLDGAYTVFGEVIEGIEIVDKIAAKKTGMADRPIQDVRIIKCRLIKE